MSVVCYDKSYAGSYDSTSRTQSLRQLGIVKLLSCITIKQFLFILPSGANTLVTGSGMYDKSYEGSYDSTSQTQTSQMSQPAQSGTPPPPPGGASDNPSLQGCLHHLAETLKQTNTVLKQAGIAGASEVESQINKVSSRE